MVMDIITSDDLTAYLAVFGITAPADPSVIVTLANGLVSDVWTPPDDGTVPATVKAITLEVASRPFRPNGSGLVRLTRQVDDASRTEQYDPASAARSGVYLTDQERARLTSVPALFGSIRVGIPAYPGGPVATETPYGLGPFLQPFEPFPDAELPVEEPFVP